MSVFANGSFTTTQFTIGTSSSASSPPKPLLIITPTSEGTFPVLLFLHGFCLSNTFYSFILQHIASHGFIIVAPQLYNWVPPLGSKEVDYAANVANWLSSGLQPLLPKQVSADLLKLGLSGHSRGGKIAFALALGHAKTSVKFSALLGLDPVAGTSKNCRTDPQILTYQPHSFDLSIPVSVIGTGLGDVAKFCLACAPTDVNHKEFFYECKPPCCYFVTEDYGHVDMLDDHLNKINAIVAGFVCKSGEGDREAMRKCVAGIMVAFFRAYLEGKSEDLMAIVDEPDIAPVKLNPVSFVGV